MEKFEKFIAGFEWPTASPEDITELIETIPTPWFEGIFRSWIGKRLREGISKPALLQYITWSTKLPELRVIGSLVNDVVIGDVLLRHQHHDYLYYILNYEKRTDGSSMMVRLSRNMGPFRMEDSLQLARDISNNTNYKYHEVILEVLQNRTDSHMLNNMITMSKLTPEDQLQIIALACLKNSFVFKDLVLSLENDVLKHAVHYQSHSIPGEDKMVHALLHTELGIPVLEERHQLTTYLLQVGPAVPYLIKHLMDRAEKEERWNYVLKLAGAYNKKESLRILLRSKDPILIDKFFFLYKDYPEVQNLTPFL